MLEIMYVFGIGVSGNNFRTTALEFVDSVLPFLKIHDFDLCQTLWNVDLLNIF